MTIHWKALEEHFLMATSAFQFSEKDYVQPQKVGSGQNVLHFTNIIITNFYPHFDLCSHFRLNSTRFTIPSPNRESNPRRGRMVRTSNCQPEGRGFESRRRLGVVYVPEDPQLRGSQNKQNCLRHVPLPSVKKTKNTATSRIWLHRQH
jgi:hypothetical protein